MIQYEKKEITSATEKEIEKSYIELLNSNNNFFLLSNQNKNYILTKEKSFFEIKNPSNFIKKAQKDIYYHTILEKKFTVEKENLKLFYFYLTKYKKLMMKKYAKNYLFGSVAVKSKKNSFITTIREKKDLNEFCIVSVQ